MGKTRMQERELTCVYIMNPVLHTLAGTFPLGLKEDFTQSLSVCLKVRFYAIITFMYLMGIFYNYAKQVAQNPMHIHAYLDSYIKGRFYAICYFIVR